MEIMSKIKEMVPWRRKPVETQEVISFRDDINRLFDRFLMSPFDGEWASARGWWPGVDLEETEDEVMIRVEVPGMEPKDLNLTVRDGLLQIRYEHSQQHHNGGYTQRRCEAFSRTVSLPSGLNTSAVKATCKHGVLTVRIPRTEQSRRTFRRIPVQG